MYKCDLLEPVSDVNESLKELTEELGSLYAESWRVDKQDDYGKPFSLNAAVFAQLWLSKGLKIFVARDSDDNMVGLLLGMVFRPLPYEASVFQFEDWYAKPGHEGAVKELFEFAANAVRFIGCDELWVADKADREPPIAGRWKETNTYKFHRYTKV